jgi:AraC-like DNA-binding protein
MLRYSTNKLQLIAVCMAVLLPLFSFAQLKEKEIFALIDTSMNLTPGDMENAEKYALRALAMASQLDTRLDSMLTRSYLTMGVVQYFRSRNNLAASYYQKALRTTYGQQQNVLAAAIWNNLGILHDQQDNLKEALEAYTRALRISEHLRDSAGMAKRWVNIAMVESKVKNYPRALQLSEQALAYASRHKDSLTMAQSHQNLAKFYEETKQPVPCLFHLQQARGLYQKLGDVYHHSLILLNTALYKMNQGDYAGAEESLTEAMHICEAQGFVTNIPLVHLRRAELALKRGESFPQALADLDKAEQLYRDNDRFDRLPGVYSVRMKIFARQGDYTRFEQAYQQYTELTEKNTSRMALAAYEEMQALYELDKKTARIGELQQDIDERKRQLIYLLLILLLIGGAAAIVTYQHLRLRRYMKTLFQLNKEQANQPMIATVEAEVPVEATNEDQQLHRLYLDLVRQLEKEKWYLDAGLSLQELSTRMASNKTYISQAVNMYSGTNVNGLLNRLRVNEARRLLLDQREELPLTEVARQSGFANRVSFYRQFKELTGFSPVEFQVLCKKPAFSQQSDQASANDDYTT